MFRLLLCAALAALLAVGAGSGSAPAASRMAGSVADGVTTPSPCPAAPPGRAAEAANLVGAAALAMPAACTDCPAMPAAADGASGGKTCTACTAPPPALAVQAQTMAHPGRGRLPPGLVASRDGEDLSPDPHPPRAAS